MFENLVFVGLIKLRLCISQAFLLSSNGENNFPLGLIISISVSLPGSLKNIRNEQWLGYDES
jgi:hypothetical protein